MVKPTELFSLVSVLLVAGAVGFALARFALPDWWRRRWLRRCVRILLAADVLVPGLWFVLADGVNPHLADGLLPWLILLFVAQLAMDFAFLLACLLHAAARGPEVDNDRRRFLLRTAAAALPVAAIGVCAAGAAEAQQVARLRRRTIALPQLPPQLDGLRVLHVSDPHLWFEVRLPDLDAALAQVPAGEADLVCVTGDIADDLDQLEPALARFAALAPPLGCFACLGNHEYSRGLRRVLATFAASPVGLLRAAGKRLCHRGADFYLVGIDDPRGQAGQERSRFFREQVAAVMAPVPPGSFTLAMSHRPGVFDAAAPAGIALTLAGHTHGGQAAVLGHSILSAVSPERYPWGLYWQGGRALHVTCGAGQWFPIRLGCPPELVMLELRRG